MEHWRLQSGRRVDNLLVIDYRRWLQQMQQRVKEVRMMVRTKEGLRQEMRNAGYTVVYPEIFERVYARGLL